MMIKTIVDFMTESGKCSLTFYRTPHEFDKTFTAMQTITGGKNKYVACNEHGCIVPNSHSISFQKDNGEANLIVHILNFLAAAGAHSTILKAIQLGSVFATAARISMVH